VTRVDPANDEVIDLKTLPPEEQKVMLDAMNELQQEIPKMTPLKAKAPPVAAMPAVAPELPTPEPHHCPNCGFDVHADPIAISDDLKRDYLRLMWGEQLFERPVSLVSGQLQLVWRERSTDVENMIIEQLLREVNDKRIPSYDAIQAQSFYQHRRIRLQLTASLKVCRPAWRLGAVTPAMDTAEAAKLFPPTDKDTVVGVAEKSLFSGKCGSSLFTILAKSFARFELLLGRLTDNADNPDFWSEIAGQPSPDVR
jgi:hypothetical protein